MSLGQPEMIISAMACFSTSISKASWRASFQMGDGWAWWITIFNTILGPGLGLKHESVSGGAFPFQGGSEEYNHILAGIVACIAAGQVY